jgi:hypothetical protein
MPAIPLGPSTIENRAAPITRRGRFYKPKGMLWQIFHRLRRKLPKKASELVP